MRRITLLAGVIAAAMGLSAVQAADRVVNVYNWSDYIAPDTIAEFEKETGIKVVYDVFDSNDMLDGKLATGNSGYDVVVPSNHYLAKQVRAGTYQKLDKSKLPHLVNLDPAIMNSLAAGDPGNEYSVPYLWGTNGIGLNLTKVRAVLGDDAPLDSAALIFEPEYAKKLSSCGIALLDAGDDVLPQMIQYQGGNPHTTSREDYQKAFDAMMKVRPFITYFHSSKFITDLAKGDICVAYGYSGDILQAADRAEEAGSTDEIVYIIPKEGAAMWADLMAIPLDAKNVAEAHEFINYMLRPEVIAKVSDYVAYANPNLNATELVDEDIRNNPGVYPSAEMIEKLYVARERERDVQRWLTRDWTRVKSGR